MSCIIVLGMRYKKDLQFSETSQGTPKLLQYDLTKLVRWGGLITAATSGTVFTMDSSLYKSAFAVLLVAVGAGVGTSLTHTEEQLLSMDTRTLVMLATHVNLPTLRNYLYICL